MLVAGILVVLAAIAVVVVVTTISGHKQTARRGAAHAAPASSGAWNIFVIGLGKREPVQLTRNEEEEFTLDPAWRPGSKIAFSQAACEGCPPHLLLVDPHSRAATKVPPRFSGFID